MDDSRQQFNDVESPPPDEHPDAKPGMGRTAKILIGCGAVFGVCAFLAVGIGLLTVLLGDDDPDTNQVVQIATNTPEDTVQSPDPTSTEENTSEATEPEPTQTEQEATATATSEETRDEEPAQTPEPEPSPTPIIPTETPEPVPEPEPTAVPSGAVFGGGTKVVGEEIQPGIYRSTGPDVNDLFGSCYWERLSGFGGTIDEVIANEFAFYRQVVEIKPDDLGFSSDGCGDWTTDLSQITADPAANFSDGTWIVGVDIAPGTWRSEVPPEGACYWERLQGFGGELQDIITNEFSDVEQVVTIAEGDVGFATSGCGVWTLASGA